MSFVKTFRVGLSRIVYARVRAAHAKRHVSLSWIPRHFRSSLIFFRLHDRYKRKNATRLDDADSPLFSGRWGLYKILVEWKDTFTCERIWLLLLLLFSDFVPRLCECSIEWRRPNTPLFGTFSTTISNRSLVVFFVSSLPCHIVVNERLHVYIWLLEKERKEESSERSLIVGAKMKTPLRHFPEKISFPFSFLVIFRFHWKNEIFTTRMKKKTRFWTLKLISAVTRLLVPIWSATWSVVNYGRNTTQTQNNNSDITIW